MSLAIAYLKAYFDRGDVTQADYAARCEVDAAHISKLLRGQVAISGRNLPKFIAGFSSEIDRFGFLVAYLRDQIPTEYAHKVTVTADVRGSDTTVGKAAEFAESEVYTAALGHIASLLPTQIQEKLYHLAKALRSDLELQDVFHAIMRYVPRDQPRIGHVPIVGAEYPLGTANGTIAAEAPLADIAVEEETRRRDQAKRAKKSS